MAHGIATSTRRRVAGERESNPLHAVDRIPRATQNAGHALRAATTPRHSTNMTTPSTDADRPVRAPWRARITRLWDWTGATPTWFAILLAGHVAFGIGRFPSGSIHKRLASIEEWNELGTAGWQFRLMDDETRRIARWLEDSVHADQLVRFDGASQGALQLLAPLVFPALLVRADADAEASRPGGRRYFDGRAPWLDAAEGAVPTVVATPDSLRLVYR